MSTLATTPLTMDSAMVSRQSPELRTPQS